jgi:MATE family multidrug resistance protein
VPAMPSTPAQWRHDLSVLLRLTGPVAAARLGVMAMGLTDALVVGRYSAEQLGYQALGWALPATVMVGAMGFLSGVQVMTSRYIGEGRPELTGGVLRRGLAYALGMGIVSGIGLLIFGPALMKAFHMAPGLAEGAAPALRIFALSLPGILVATAAGLYLEALGKPSVSMTAMWLANGVNLAIDLVLVPGAFGLPAMGAAGAACATLGARAFLAALLLIYIARMKEARALGLFEPARDGAAAAAEQRRVGYGAGASQFVEAAAFSGMNVVAGWIGALTVAGWAVVLNLTAIVFMAPLGLATATAVLIGRAYGARDAAGVMRAGVLGFATAATYGALAGAAVFAGKPLIAAAYTSDPALLGLAIAALALVALSFAPDAVQVVAAQALRARGDVLAPTVTHVASYAVVMLPLGWALSTRMGLDGIVLAVILASLLSAGLLIGRFAVLSRPGA